MSHKKGNLWIVGSLRYTNVFLGIRSLGFKYMEQSRIDNKWEESKERADDIKYADAEQENNGHVLAVSFQWNITLLKLLCF